MLVRFGENTRLKTILIYVNSQFGVGHFQRCFCILQELEERHKDLKPMLVFGGLPHYNFDGLNRTTKVRLPGLTYHRSDDKIGYEPRPVVEGRTLEDVLDERRDLISAAIRDSEVQVLFLEYYPFSKQFLRSEVDYLLEEIKKKSSPTVVSSVRDFMTIDQGFDRVFTQNFILKNCSYVLVHSDPRFAELDTTYGNIFPFRHKIRYTGYIVDSGLLVNYPPRRKNLIAVSMGGGKDGGSLIELFFDAIHSIAPTFLTDFEIRIFPGPFYPEKSLNILVQMVSDLKNCNVRICRFEEYRDTISKCSASISMCGYNTAAELIVNQVPHIWFAPRQRTEQLMRAEMLSQLGLARVVSSSKELEEFLRDMSQEPAMSKCRPANINFDGARETANFLYNLLQSQEI